MNHMKRISFTTLLLATMMLGMPAAFAHADITSNLTAWWKFDEGSGSTAVDSSGSGKNGNETNSPSYVAGKIGAHALSFNGSTSYVDIPSLTVTYSAFTVSAWIKPSNINNGDNPRIVADDHTDSDDKGFQLMYNNGGATGFFDVGNGTTEGRATWSQQLANGTWYLYTGVYDGSYVYAYINGVLVATTSYSGGAIAAGSVDVNIARNAQYSGDYFPGAIDEVRIYNRALSSTDVAQLYAYPSACGVMSSSNYCLESDSINFGGGNSTSTNYIQESTFGEVATGFSSSTNYILGAGYQQMTVVALSLVPPSNVVMSPSLGGVSGGTSNGSTAFTVTTDDPAGYTATIQASSSPALVNIASSSYAFADYAPSGSAPDYSFSNAATTSAFAFSPQGIDADQRFLNNGAACNTGAVSTAQTCWDGLSTSAKNVSDRTSNNTPAGSVTTLWFRAATGSHHIQASGTYVATTTLTVLPL